MKLTFLFLIYFLSQNVFSQEIETIEGSSVYIISEDKNEKTIIFLHGGVNNPIFEQPADNIPLDYIIENNQDFLTQASINGFNVIIPITNDSLNWLENPQETFIELKRIVAYSGIDSQEIYISGFSDGGTGSFKIFYQNPNYFEGLIVFSGYPQHKNFYKSVNYDRIENKKVLFFGTDKDKVIPYEFLLTEYCLQKQSNPNTFIYLSSGDHSFANYTKEDIKYVFDILTGKNENKETKPIQGFIENDKLVKLYPFRKKIIRNFGFGQETYQDNRRQQKNGNEKQKTKNEK